ncbi:MAG: DUF1501 domain-containing protein, partial [Chthonomonadales bacterium]
MDPIRERELILTRRQLFGRTATGIGTAALSTLLNSDSLANITGRTGMGSLGQPHHTPKAKRVISLFQSGAPSHLDLFDYKPRLHEHFGIDLPDSIRMGQRITGMTSGQKTLPVAPSVFKFNRYGKQGVYMSEILPHTGSIADKICLIRSMHTEAINHDPAITFIQTGSQLQGRPSIGSWLSYGLGSENENLPSYIV